MVGAGRVTGAGAEDALAAALAEIAALREENERLRGLLGLTDERSADPPPAVGADAVRAARSPSVRSWIVGRRRRRRSQLFRCAVRRT